MLGSTLPELNFVLGAGCGKLVQGELVGWGGGLGGVEGLLEEVTDEGSLAGGRGADYCDF